MSDLVDRTLSEWRRGGHVWGQSDCLLSIGDYIAAAGHRDVSSIFRGTYGDEAGALAHIDHFGGPAALVDLTGLLRVNPPDHAVRGDVVIVDTGEAGIAALCTGDTVAMRLERGVVEVQKRLVRLIAAWRV